MSHSDWVTDIDIDIGIDWLTNRIHTDGEMDWLPSLSDDNEQSDGNEARGTNHNSNSSEAYDVNWRHNKSDTKKK